MFEVKIKTIKYVNGTKHVDMVERNGKLYKHVSFYGRHLVSKTSEVHEFKTYDQAIDFVTEYNESQRVLGDGYKVAEHPVEIDVANKLLEALLTIKAELGKLNIARLPQLFTVSNPAQYERTWK